MTASRLLLLSCVLGLALLAIAAFRQRGYYTLEAPARPQHKAHATLRSSGDVGLLCGIVGSALILLNLTYLIRKRVTRARFLGSLPAWMGFHVATGLMGAGLILIHSAFLVRSAPGLLAIGCLGVVVTTGLIGRYLHRLVPRSPAGRELERADLRRRFNEHREALADCGVAWASLQTDPTNDISAGRSPLARFLGVMAGDRAIRREYRALSSKIRSHPRLGAKADTILPLAHRCLREAQWLRRYSDLRGLMGSWRFMHRWLAIVMVIVVTLHILLALRYGDLRPPRSFLP